MTRWQYNTEFPVQATRKDKSFSGKKGVIFCPNCHSVYYRKAWHHSQNKVPSFLPNRQADKFQVLRKLCSACLMIKNKEFAGQLTIVNFPLALKTDLIKLIDNFCQRAYRNNTLHRLIDIKNINNDLVVATTENQLAVKLAKKIKEVFNKNKIQLKISYSPEPNNAVYVKVNFTE